MRLLVPGHPHWVLGLFLSRSDSEGPGLHAFLELRPPGSDVPEMWVSAVWPGRGRPWRSALASAASEWVSFGEDVSGALGDVLRPMLDAVGAGCPGLAGAAEGLVTDPGAHVLAAEVMES